MTTIAILLFDAQGTLVLELDETSYNADEPLAFDLTADAPKSLSGDLPEGDYLLALTAMILPETEPVSYTLSLSTDAAGTTRKVPKPINALNIGSLPMGVIRTIVERRQRATVTKPTSMAARVSQSHTAAVGRENCIHPMSTQHLGDLNRDPTPVVGIEEDLRVSDQVAPLLIVVGHPYQPLGKLLDHQTIKALHFQL